MSPVAHIGCFLSLMQKEGRERVIAARVESRPRQARTIICGIDHHLRACNASPGLGLGLGSSCPLTTQLPLFASYQPPPAEQYHQHSKKHQSCFARIFNRCCCYGFCWLSSFSSISWSPKQQLLQVFSYLRFQQRLARHLLPALPRITFRITQPELRVPPDTTTAL